ncbi:efflux RND transporter periplasmic adaptor subunit [Hydrogenimonas urashimensis]|uniref:efflux RND transporter periplasmic adaptor subunit n=1 Tax=Hydrogenimonas urashimensis TaxID=2740515 RepID=UPI0019169F90|nr:efflux RND transporter periplasmic adaptor subunit [Hydrogenimonas urashimensis]
MANRSIKTALFLLLAGLAGWLFYEKVYIPKSTYQAVTAKEGVMEATVFGIGTVGAKNLYPLCSVTGGKLLTVAKEEGEWVKKGDIIARIDPVDLPQQLEAARATERKARFEIEAAKKSLEALQAQKRLATITYQRYATLKSQGFAAKAEYDKAKADLDALKAQIAAAKSQIAASKALARQAEHNVKAIEKRLTTLTITAPFDGYVVKKEARAAQTIAPQAPILTLVRPEEVWVRINIDERISGRVKVGQKANIHLRSHPKEAMTGHVARIEPESDPVTEERIVDIRFDRLPHPFYLNEQAEARIATGKIDRAVILPTKVFTHGGVWVYKDGKVHFKKVEILAENEGRAAVRGIEAGSKVLIPDPHKKPLFENGSVRL